MKPDLFEELRESAREGGAILRGQRKPSRTSHFGEPDVRAVRESYRLSQSKFAALMASVRPLYETGNRAGGSPKAAPESSCESWRDTQKQYSMSLAQPARGAAPDLALKRTHRSRIRSGRSLGSPLNVRPLDGRRNLPHRGGGQWVRGCHRALS